VLRRLCIGITPAGAALGQAEVLSAADLVGSVSVIGFVLPKLRSVAKLGSFCRIHLMLLRTLGSFCRNRVESL
jgi:hypothetical protein